MLTVLSPAKKLNMDPVDGATATPEFAAQATELAGIAGALSAAELSKLMHISADLGRLNAERFANFGDQPRKAAIHIFAGDTYQGLEAQTLDADALQWAAGRLRILSGLYGVLRPMDAIEPYRLEMGSRLKTPGGTNLYQYWGDKPARALNALGAAAGTDVLVNCASQEYFGAVDQDALALRIITPVFLEDKGGVPKIVSFYAKKARGAMARYMMENRLTDPDALKEFDTGGYAYRPDLSEGDRWAFVRAAA